MESVVAIPPISSPISRAKKRNRRQRSPSEFIEARTAGIRHAWLGRRQEAINGTKLAPYDIPLGLLKRELYMFGQQIIDERMTAELMQFAERNGARTAGESADGLDLYRWLLTAFPEAELPRSEKRRLAHELQYARRHGVPAEYLVGFLYQSGSGADIYARVADEGHVEDWYRSATRLSLREARRSRRADA